MIDAWTFYAAAVPAVLITGLSKGGFATGAGMAATPIMAMATDPATAAAVMLPILCLMDVAAIRLFWGEWDWPNVRAMCLGSIAGVALGAVTFHLLDADALRVLLGVLTLGFLVWTAVKDRLDLPAASFSMGKAGFWGAAAGFTSFSAHAGAPPVAMNLLPQKLHKTTFQATSALFFMWVNAIKLPPYAALGLLRGDGLATSAVLAPVALGGVALGAWLHRRMSDRWFFGLTQFFLLAAGIKLIWDGLA